MKVVDIYADNVLNAPNPSPLIFQTAVLCNKAGNGRGLDGVEKVFGDPTEIGLLECAQHYGFKKTDLEKIYPLVSEFAFDSDRKRMSILRTYD